MIAGHLGRSDPVTDALSVIVRPYADQTEADHAASVAVVDGGWMPVQRGVSLA